MLFNLNPTPRKCLRLAVECFFHRPELDRVGRTSHGPFSSPPPPPPSFFLTQTRLKPKPIVASELAKMFRRAAASLASAAARNRRLFSTGLSAASTTDGAFVEAWTKIAPKIEPPKTPITFMDPRPPTPASIPSKLTVNFVLPYAAELSAKEVDMVIIPATSGQMGVLPGHVATIAELKPGVLSVHEGNNVNKYFVSSGFAFIHANSYADIIAVEAVPVDQIDSAAVQKGLADFSQKLNTATTDLEKAEAQIGIDVHSALNAAITG
ncbi:hypothetical protein MLD38_023778 [Melastoma candidum]|uniref:Uncharacterized protein n=2 Tax=Melastoma candidum TaxID=119954 RepID=A0ACB9NSY4_9MYRT|nr:hypothetical protein MLD38_023778 [Melastoma candidum]